jgi:hypothetical protein
VRLGSNSIEFSGKGDNRQEKKGSAEPKSKLSLWSRLPMRDCMRVRVGDIEDIVVEDN